MKPDDVAERLRELAAAARARNGRLAIDWLSRAQKPRWRMVWLDGEWYNRARLRRDVDARPRAPAVPASRRPLTPAELADLRDPNPWGLFPPRRRS